MKPTSLILDLHFANRVLLLAVIMLSVSMTSFAGSGSGKLDFKDAQLKSGVAGADLLRTGAVATGAKGATKRMYSLNFQDFKYNQPTQATLPVTLKSFDTKLISSKVQLDWSTSEELNFSHFIIERSTDGKEYKETALIFADAHSINYTYSYAEPVNQNASGFLYYRLKMVDRDATFKYSAIRIVKMNVKNSVVSISAYPNPVTNELRITIPSNWQAKQIVYDVVNMNGVIMKHKISASAQPD